MQIPHILSFKNSNRLKPICTQTLIVERVHDMIGLCIADSRSPKLLTGECSI